MAPSDKSVSLLLQLSETISENHSEIVQLISDKMENHIEKYHQKRFTWDSFGPTRILAFGTVIVLMVCGMVVSFRVDANQVAAHTTNIIVKEIKGVNR